MGRGGRRAASYIRGKKIVCLSNKGKGGEKVGGAVLNPQEKKRGMLRRILGDNRLATRWLKKGGEKERWHFPGGNTRKKVLFPPLKSLNHFRSWGKGEKGGTDGPSQLQGKEAARFPISALSHIVDGEKKEGREGKRERYSLIFWGENTAHLGKGRRTGGRFGCPVLVDKRRGTMVQAPLIAFPSCAGREEGKSQIGETVFSCRNVYKREGKERVSPRRFGKKALRSASMAGVFHTRIEQKKKRRSCVGGRKDRKKERKSLARILKLDEKELINDQTEENRRLETLSWKSPRGGRERGTAFGPRKKRTSPKATPWFFLPRRKKERKKKGGGRGGKPSNFQIGRRGGGIQGEYIVVPSFMNRRRRKRGGAGFQLRNRVWNTQAT